LGVHGVRGRIFENGGGKEGCGWGRERSSAGGVFFFGKRKKRRFVAPTNVSHIGVSRWGNHGSTEFEEGIVQWRPMDKVRPVMKEKRRKKNSAMPLKRRFNFEWLGRRTWGISTN